MTFYGIIGNIFTLVKILHKGSADAFLSFRIERIVNVMRTLPKYYDTLSEKEVEFLELYRKLPKDQRKEFLGQIRELVRKKYIKKEIADEEKGV